MAKLILSMDGLVLKEVALNKERMTIGRRASNDVQIENLAISGEHAAVVTILDDSFLEDLNSTNGTLVNGQPIRKHFLKDGDVIEMGKYKLKYVVGQPSPVEAGIQEKSVAFQADSAPPAETTSTAHAPDSSAVMAATVPFTPSDSSVMATQPISLPAAAIQVLNGLNAGRELELSKTLTTLGRPGVQVAVITRRPHGYFITHVEGAQFPVVNGKALDAQAYQLKNHDIIELVGTKMEFFLKE